MAAPQTKPPSGITLERVDSFSPGLDEFKFTINMEWKIGDSDYNDGQQYIYESRYVAQPGNSRPKNYSYRGKTETLGKTATSKSKVFDYKSFYPFKDRYLYSLQFFVRGNRAKYTSGSGKKKKTIDPSWSAWYSGVKEYVFMVPPKPVLGSELLTNDTTRFVWELSDIEKPQQCFVDFEYESLLVKDNTYTRGNISSADWKNKADNKGNTQANAGTTSSYKEITEDSSKFSENGYSYTRWFRVRSRGPRGWSDWVYDNHVYAKSAAVKNASSSQTNNASTGGITISASWETDASTSKPVDEIKVFYKAVVPEATQTINSANQKITNIVCPSPGDGWTEVVTLSDSSGKGGMSFDLPPTIDDEVIFVKTDTYHDGIATSGIPVLVDADNRTLAPPTINSIVPNETTHRVTVDVTNNSQVPKSDIFVIYREEHGLCQYLGVIPNGSTSAIVQCPDWGNKRGAIGVQAVLGSYTPPEIPPRDEQFTTPIKFMIFETLMESQIIWNDATLPSTPAMPILYSSATNSSIPIGTIRVMWPWTWTDADTTEISWADHKDAWESTDGPNSCEVSRANSSGIWNISGLSIGTWYVRLRLMQTTDNGVISTGYSEIAKIKLASVPDTPSLTILPSVAALGDKINCSWLYASDDATQQAQAEICQAFGVDTGTITYGEVIAKTGTSQAITIDTSDPKLNWENGNDYYLCVRVRSSAGELSEGWSNPKKIHIAPKPVATVSSTSLSNGELKSMPLTITATGAGSSGTTIAIIERAEDYFVDRPDENQNGGFEGETVAIISKSGEGVITINQSDLLAPFDDGAKYRLSVMVTDTYGQSATSRLIDFKVNWTHQALIPTAYVELDHERLVTYITPIAPSGTTTGDVCDIYRLSVDKPELIYANAEFGTKYVDPYPTLGEFGGHRIVFKTVNGDYITASNQFAWTDYPLDGGDDDGVFEDFLTIIDYDGNRVELPYDIDVSNSWAKDFKQTHYLGGSIQGDWNVGVERTGSVSSNTAVEVNPETVEAMRRLAEYPGVCHVRTPEGSSFTADVQITEDREAKMVNKLAKFSIDITRVDSEGFDAQEYDDWIATEGT